MTTLPQTANPRLPARAVGPAVPMVHANAPGGPVASSMTGGDVWRVLRANMWIILLFVIVAGLGGLALNELVLAKYYSRYTATGWINITPTRAKSLLDREGNFTGIETGMISILQRRQAALMKADGLLTEFLEKADDSKKTRWYQKFQLQQPDGSTVFDIAEAKEALQSSLSIVAMPETDLIQISMTTPEPETSRIVVEELVNTHLRQQAGIQQTRESTEVQDLNKLKASLNLRLSTVDDDLRRLQIDLNKGGYKTSQMGMSQKEAELMELLRSRMMAQQDLSDANSLYQSVTESIQNGITPPEVEAMMNQDQRIFQKKLQKDAAESELQQFESTFGKENPRYKLMENAYNIAVRQHDDAVSEFRSSMTGQLQTRSQLSLQSAQTGLQGIEARIEDLRSEVGDLDYKMVQFLAKKEEKESIAESLQIIQEKLSEKSLNREILTGVGWAQLPQTPTSASFPKRLLTLSASIAVGLLLSLGIAFLRELLDTTVRSPRDIARVGNMNLLGMIPHEDDDPQVAGVPMQTVIFQAPMSAIAEQFRQVRSRLQHAASLDTTRTILVTSPSPADGKSTVACNLAAGLALNGRRILLVDANFRRPVLHKLFNVGNETGFSSVFASLDNLQSSIKPTNVPNLDVLPTGPKPANATELLESSLFSDFVDKVLQDYDHIIFDTGPLLFVSETVAMAPRVDGVVTVVRASANSRGLLQRERDQLKQLKVEHLGVVLNAVRSQGGGYYGRNIKTYYEYSNGHNA